MRNNKEEMTGNDLRGLREQLGMDPFAFAMLVGVHVSTIYRWESARDRPVKMDPLQRELLHRLAARFEKANADRKNALGQALVAGLIAGGMIAGLAVLINYLNDGTRRR